MWQRIYILGLIFCFSSFFSQNKSKYAEVDNIITKANDSINNIVSLVKFIEINFKEEEFKCRAIYKWITTNIEYDLNSMYTINLKAKKDDIISAAVSDRKAICMGYAYVFDTVCKLSGIKSEVIVGSTRQSWFPEPTGHAWNSVKINEKWYLVDPTWGSGTISNRKFVKKLNEKYFLASGLALRPSHHPIDPIWQLNEKVISLENFYNPKSPLGSYSKDFWNYEDSIKDYYKADYIDKLKSTQRRLKGNGTNSNVTSDYYVYLENVIINQYNKKLKSGFSYSNNAINGFNEYINYKNNQFTPAVEDEEINKMLPKIEEDLYKSEDIFSEIRKLGNEEINEQINQNLKHQNELKNRIKEEKEFVKLYLATKKNKRRDLFYKKTYSIFGLPVK